MTQESSQDQLLTIGQLSKRCALSAKTIRYYEAVGLLPEPERGANAYRYYDRRAVHILRFVGRARELGFSMEDIAELLTLWNNKRRMSKNVRAIAQAHLETIQDKICKLEGMQSTLQDLIHCCRGDERPDCPILEELASPESSSPKRQETKHD